MPDLKSLTKGKGNINTKNPILTNKSNKKITIGTRNVTKESVRSEENKRLLDASNNKKVGLIAMDSLYSPIER